MKSPFQESAESLRSIGYSVIPLVPKTKSPAIAGKDWQQYGLKQSEDIVFERWMRWSDCNIGVCLGTASNLVGIDYDYDVDGLHEKIESILPRSPVAKMGAKGKTVFYQFNGQKSQGFSKNGERILDILSQGRQTVLPPSIHDKTLKPYVWLTEKTLENTPSTDLPHIPLQAIYEIASLFDIKETKESEKREWVTTYDDTSKQDVIDALHFIPSDDYDMWYKVGMSLKDKFGDSGFELWDGWSSRSTKYNGKEMRNKWNSFHGAGITLASLFYYAMDNGFSYAKTINSEPVHDFTLNGKRTGRVESSAVTEIVIAEKMIDRMVFPSELLNAPGLIGQFQEFINKTSLMPQPVLALGASIAAAGSLMGRKIKGDTGLRTNFYIIGLAPSGAGKDHARTVIKRVLHDTGLGGTELGIPASSAGLISGLRDRGIGRGIVLWDEFGRVLKQMTHWKAGTHERDIITTLMELFSSSQSVYMGKAYANHDGKNPLKPLDQPCLSVYGTSVPNHFFEALSGSDAIDGFLSRWLVFESRDYTLEEEERIPDVADIPEALIEACRFWKEQKFFHSDTEQGNMTDGLIINPRTVQCTSGASRLLKDFSLEMRKRAIGADAAKDATAAIWSRAGEHARRLALAGQTGYNIDSTVAEWGIKTALYCSEYMASAITDYVSSSELESQTKRILKMIKESGGPVGRGDIAKAFQGIQARVRNEILTSLLERGEIAAEKTASASGPPAIRYTSFPK